MYRHRVLGHVLEAEAVVRACLERERLVAVAAARLARAALEHLAQHAVPAHHRARLAANNGVKGLYSL